MTRIPRFNSERILLVEDDVSLRTSLVGMLEDMGLETDSVSDGLTAIKQIRESVYDILLTDLRLPGISGEKIVSQARSQYPDMIVIVITGYADIRNAVEMMRLGANDYIQKPFLKDELVFRLDRALEERRWRWQTRALQEGFAESKFDNLVGESATLRRVKEMVSNVSAKRTTVLIYGETGTGKELVARAIHSQSPRCDHPLVGVNCGAIPANLMEDEFFGHEKGAFTDAQQLRPGRFEQANRGTIFLDEIGSMPLELQSKLLRVLQERECQRIGGTQTIRLDVRFLAATNVNLEDKVRAGSFREDLFYRLNVFPIFVPPLRERKDDIPALVPHLLLKICAREGLQPKEISQDAMRQLLQYEWPGNIRQLENALEMGVILAGERRFILADDLPQLFHHNPDSPHKIDVPPEGVDFQALVSGYERALIREGLKRAEGKRSKAASLLNLKRTTLLEKIKKLEAGVM